MGVAALLYLLLPFFWIPMPGLHSSPLRLSELLLPLVAWQFWRKRKQLCELAVAEGRYLLIALIWAAVAFELQLMRGMATPYNFAILVYMAAVFCFFRVTRLPRARICCGVGIALLTAVFLGWACSRGGVPECPLLRRLVFVDPHMDASNPGLLSLRFQWFFTNPNLFGSAFIIPAALALRDASGRLTSVRRVILAALLALVFSLPLLASASKHLLMTFALIAGTLAAAPVLSRFKPAAAAYAAVVLLGCLAFLTVCFRSYPAVSSAPYIDFSHRGSYTTHQQVYARIITREGVRGALFGHSEDELRELYPRHADQEQIRAVLEPYGAAGLAPAFASFMDPHNEYLNLASLFGVPVMLFAVAFMGHLGLMALKRKDWPAALWFAALFFCCLWDDLGSKRWIWAMSGMLTQQMTARERQAG